jgi:hypothetical protein
MSMALCLFDQLCDVGNALVLLRDREEPCSDRWCDLTCLVLALDSAIDTLVRSEGFACDNEVC